ncbi:MAG: hypothetical protein M1830_008991 [Pleopsidium flavum]|nr:MAG: hypothetical protein M1830_008991 [Pleopsidium flavum]
MDWDTICFNAAAFVAGLFLLELGADTFVDNTAIVARRLCLAVVIAAVIQQKSPLAIGNVVGSSISNILGAFSLGLLFHSEPTVFDRSSKIYTALLLLLTSVFVALAFFKQLGKITGGIFVSVFAIYVASIGFAIYRGVLDAPEGSDDESGNESSDEETDEESTIHQPLHSEASPLLSNGQAPEAVPVPPKSRAHHGLIYHICQLLFGFISLSISGYVLSRSASSLADAVHLSGTVLGITILSFATTLPEKFVAVLGGSRGHAGIVVANTAGSNIFLLTLCLGVVLLSGDLDRHASSVVPFELAVTWASAAILFVVVMLGSRRWVGGVLLLLYIAFLILEFTAYRR